MNKTLKALSILLSYPSVELQAASGDIRQALTEEGLVAAELLEPLLSQLESSKLLALQAHYVDLFDCTPRLSLYLFEHVHGDSRERGLAMVELLEFYRRHGLELNTRQLPDYLPLVLEFLAVLPLAEAQLLLEKIGPILAVLKQRLEERQSPYAVVFSALLERSPTKPDAKAMGELQELPDADPQALDRGWEEIPVSFGPAARGSPEAAMTFKRRKL